MFPLFLLSLFLFSLLSFSSAAPYNQIGPRNVLNEVNNNGEAGTCADAVSHSSNPNIIYTGGSNNGASTGVWKSVNGGANWVQTPGMRDGRVYGLFIMPSDPNTLFAGTPTGIYYTNNAAASWSLASETTTFGLTRNFVLINIDGVDTILAASENGVSYRPALPIGQATWKIFDNKPAGTPGLYFISAAKNGAKATVVTTIQQTVYTVLIGGGNAVYTKTPMTANTVSVNPRNPNHFLASHPPDGNAANDYSIFESLDGGQTSARKGTRRGVWYVLFDPVVNNQIWVAGQQLYAKSTDGGNTFTVPFRVNTRSKQGFSMQSSFFDYQRILFNVGKYPYAVCSDQGLYGYPGTGEIITAVNGDMGFTIATGVAIAKDLASNNINIVATMWDRGPTASWDGGKSWPATEWFGSAYWKQLGPAGSPANFFEGGEIYTIGNRGPNMIAHNNNEKIYYSPNAGKDWTIFTLPTGTNCLYRSFDYFRSTAGVPNGQVWIVASGKIFSSSNYGSSWSAYGAAAPPSGSNTLFVAFDPTQPSSLWAGSANCLTKTSDGGASWTPCTQPASQMTRLIIKNDGSVYFLTQRLAAPLKSTNKGTSWSGVSNNDVNNAARTSDQNYASYSPSGKALVLLAPNWRVGTVRPFIFRSFDDGATWTEESGDITLMTNQLTNHNWYDGDLYISTGGQGILQFPNFDVSTTPTTTTTTTTKPPSTTTTATTTTTTTPSTFGIYWKSHQDRVIDIDNANNVDGTALKFWSPNGPNGGPGGAQLFEWVGDKTTGAQLRWVGTNKCIDNTSGKNENGNKLIIWTCSTSNNNQRWIHLSSTNQIQWKGSNRCIDVTNGQYEPAGALVQIYDCNPSEPNQLFILK